MSSSHILSLSETTEPQKIYDYISQISKKKLYKNKPILRKTKYEFDDYIVPTVTLRMEYEDKELFVRIVNSKPGYCDVIINDNGKLNKCKLYINSFYEFTF